MRVEAVALGRLPGSVRAQAVDQPRPGIRQEAAEDPVARAVQAQTGGLGHAVGVEQAPVDGVGVLREHGEVDAAVAQARAQRGVVAGLQARRVHQPQAHRA